MARKNSDSKKEKAEKKEIKKETKKDNKKDKVEKKKEKKNKKVALPDEYSAELVGKFITGVVAQFGINKRALDALLRNVVEGKKIRKKNIREEGKPKKSPSAFILFCNENRAKVREENPKEKISQITSILSKMWNELKDKDKKKYQKKADKLKEKYQEEVEQWKAEREKTNPTKPKRPHTAFIIYCNDYRSQVKKDNPEMKATQVVSELGKMWRKIKDKEKSKYIKLAEERKKDYQVLVDEWKKKVEKIEKKK